MTGRQPQRLTGAVALLAAFAACFAFTSVGAAPRKKVPPPPTGELLLDMDAPIITVQVAGVDLRLRVGLEHKKLIELNPAAAARLPIAFERGFDANVGRETLRGIAAAAEARIDDRTFPILLSSHGRDCCSGADGAIGASALPYAAIRFARRGASSNHDLATRQLEMTDSDARGLEARLPSVNGAVSAQFSLERPETVATAAAGAILAKAYGGRREGGEAMVAAAFGTQRPAETVRFARPFRLAGFAFDHLTVRIADFAGRHELPRDPGQPGDIVVNRRVTPQEAWPVVLIGRDRLDRCAELSFETQTVMLTLRCDFDSGAK